MGKGFVSGRDLNPHGCDLRICSPDGIVERITAGHRLGHVSETAPDNQYALPLLTSEFALDVAGGAR